MDKQQHKKAIAQCQKAINALGEIAEPYGAELRMIDDLWACMMDHSNAGGFHFVSCPICEITQKYDCDCDSEEEEHEGDPCPDCWEEHLKDIAQEEKESDRYHEMIATGNY